MRVLKWGDDLAIQLPTAVVEALELKEGDEIEIRVTDARRLTLASIPEREELLKRPSCLPWPPPNRL
jgi:antitoxin MazE